MYLKTLTMIVIVAAATALTLPAQAARAISEIERAYLKRFDRNNDGVLGPQERRQVGKAVERMKLEAGKKQVQAERKQRPADNQQDRLKHDTRHDAAGGPPVRRLREDAARQAPAQRRADRPMPGRMQGNAEGWPGPGKRRYGDGPGERVDVNDTGNQDGRYAPWEGRRMQPKMDRTNRRY